MRVDRTGTCHFLKVHLEASKQSRTCIPMTYKNMSPMPEVHSQAIKAVVSGSAADIIKAMRQDK